MIIIFIIGLLMFAAGVGPIIWKKVRPPATQPASVSVTSAGGSQSIMIVEAEQVPDCPVPPRQANPDPAPVPDQRGKVQRGLFEDMEDTFPTQTAFYTRLSGVLQADIEAAKARDAMRRVLAESIGITSPKPAVAAPAPSPAAPIPAAAPAPVAAAAAS